MTILSNKFYSLILFSGANCAITWYSEETFLNSSKVHHLIENDNDSFWKTNFSKRLVLKEQIFIFLFSLFFGGNYLSLQIFARNRVNGNLTHIVTATPSIN